jgi:hypothetical protein
MYVIIQHPVIASFCMLSPAETSGIDAMSLVKPGMAVAFAADRKSEGSKRLKAYPSAYIQFARVEHVDTVRCLFYARSLVSGNLLNPAPNSNQVVGIEDITKRRCFLRYAPAPDSATELESLTDSASVGHLVLALQWCASVQSSSAVVERLAELLSTFLGAEVSMHAANGGTRNKPKEEAERLQAQLLELFGHPPEKKRGLLIPVLKEPTLSLIQQQLATELLSAAEAESSRHAKNDMTMEVEDGIFSRSSGQNPFSSLRMDYL